MRRANTGRKSASAKQAATASRATKAVVKVLAPTKARTAARLVGEERASGPRRAIFIDVENTSSEDSLTEVLEGLKIDRGAQPTELTAVGNWRAVGQRLGRHLASLGAQLVHSAPALGVRDWSDLWIAVAAGCWLGQSAPGDILEIVSNDRAFDAVGDAAAARGVIFHRLQHRRGAVAATTSSETKPASARRSRGGRRRRRGGGRPTERPLPTAAAPPPPLAPVARRQPNLAAIEPHGATREQMIGVIGRLTGGDPDRWANLDVLEKALKAGGFARPPGSPRLVTRLRMLKEVEVDSHGRVRLVPGMASASEAEAPGEPAPRVEEAPQASDAAPASGTTKRTPPKRRRRRRSKSSGSGEDAPGRADAQPA